MLVNWLPYHIDITPVHLRVQQNLILNRLKQFIDLETSPVTLKLTEDALVKLKKCPYLVTFNTGKSDYYLYCTRDNNRQTTLLINQKLNRMWSIPSEFPDSCYGDTLFEITLLKEDSHFLVLISDLLVYQGKNLVSPTKKTHTEAFPVRLKKLKEIMANYEWRNDTFEYILKPYVGYEYLESLWFDLKPTLDYRPAINGLYFRGVDANANNYYYLISPQTKRPTLSQQQQQSLSQPQPSDKAMLLLEKTEVADCYKLYTLDHDQHPTKSIGVALVNDLITSQKLLREMSDCNKAVYMCEWNEYFKKWHPVEKEGAPRTPSLRADRGTQLGEGRSPKTPSAGEAPPPPNQGDTACAAMGGVLNHLG